VIDVSPDIMDEPATSQGVGGLIRVRLDLAYDGTDFTGWAIQEGSDLRTVQGEVEAALATVLRVDGPLRLTVAGRTDAGVHARGQVAHVDLPAELWNRTTPEDVLRRLNGILDDDVLIHAVAAAAPGFDARFSPLSRIYRYRLCDDLKKYDPLRRHDVVLVKGPLNVAQMNEAASLLVGLRDFASFCRKRERATTIRTLIRCSFSRTDDGLVVATVEADAFCHSMVRSIVGALLDVGQGRHEPAWITRTAEALERTAAIQVAPALGLTLEEIVYPPDEDLPAQAERTRRRRA
jgi:tRNA pseudouridine38-40 synthase